MRAIASISSSLHVETAVNVHKSLLRSASAALKVVLCTWTAGAQSIVQNIRSQLG